LIVGFAHYMRVPVVGLVIAIALLGFLAAFPARLSLGAFALVLGVLGVGLGPMYTVGTVVMQNAVKRHEFWDRYRHPQSISRVGGSPRRRCLRRHCARRRRGCRKR